MKRLLIITLLLATSVVVALAFWHAPGAGTASATSGSFAAATIGVPPTAYNAVTVTWSQQASLEPVSAENSAITYSVERRLGAGTYAAVTSGDCAGTKTYGVASCTDTPPGNGSYSYRAVATYRTWTATSNEAGPVSFASDTAAPTNAITLSNVTGGAFKSGATVYYRGLASGSLTLTNAVSDGGSGPASSETSALSGVLVGWTHSPSLVSSPAGGPYVSSLFSWSALTTSSPGETVTGADAAGNTAATALTFSDDSVAPSGGTVDATGLGGTGGRDSTSTNLSLAFSTGTDGGSGLAPTGAQLLRASALLSDGSCGSYSAYAQVGGDDPASPVANTVPVDHTCYRYRYLVLDRVGNQATYTSPDIKVDTSAAHPDFLQPITSPETVRAGPAGMATGDVDNDGDQDVVTTSIFTGATSVLINNGVGEFREKTVASNLVTADVGLGKFDNDNNLDLVLLYGGSPPAAGLLVIFKGGGDGTFTYLGLPNEIANTGVRPLSLAVGNFNGDTIDDVAVVNQQNDPETQAGTVTTYMGNPAGNDAFASAAAAQTLDAQIGTMDIAHADFDGGAKDLVVTNRVSSSITLLSGNGAGFNAPTHIAAGVPVNFFDTANLNPGTNQDIVATVYGSNPSAIRTLFGDGAGGFPTQTTTQAARTGTGHTPEQVVAKDFDNDGDADVAIANAAPETVLMLANDGTGAYTIAPASPETGIGPAGLYPFGLVSADFDGNGFYDLAASPLFTTAPGEVRVLHNQNGSRADLSITQTDSPDPVPGGQNLTYTLTVANAGTGTPSSVKASDTLPTGVTFNAAASSPTCSAAGAAPVTVTCDYGAVASGSPEALQVVVTPGAGPSTLINTATVAGNLADGTPANNTSTATTTVSDSTGPTGGSVDATGLVGTGARYSTSTTLSLALAKGTDSSGLATSGAQLWRATATLTSTAGANGICGAIGVYTQVATDPVSPAADIVPSGQACYRYEYRVPDTVGNSTTYTSPDIKVDTTAPAAPTLAFSAMTNTFSSGTTLYYRSNAASGAFTVTASSTDANSGITGYTLPTLPAGWTTSGTLAVRTYSWSAANPTPPSGSQDITATNNANLTSAATGTTLVSDITAPATGSVTYTNGTYTTPSVSVTFARGTDAGSGVDATSGLLQRAEATLTGGECVGAYGGFATITGGTNPTSPFADTGVVTGKCYQYRYLASDNVGNQTTYTSANVAKVTTYAGAVTSTPGLVNQWRLGETYTPVATDTFNIGSPGAALSTRAGELGTTWTNWGAPYGVTTAMVLSNETRVRKSGTGFNYYRASAAPASADYAVEADVYRKTLVSGDRAGVVGRFDPAGGGLEDWYEGYYDATAGSWALRKAVNQTLANLTSNPAASAQTLTAGQPYRLRLEMIGTSIRLYVDGVLKVSGTDASVTVAGKGGVFSGNGGVASTVSDTTGLHLDNFQMLPTTATAADSRGTAPGTYFNGPTLGVADPLSGDSNTAVTFDGVDDYVSMARQVQDNLSLEFWFKSTKGLGLDAGWTLGSGMVDSNISGSNNDFGVSLRSDGRVVGGIGGAGGVDSSVVSTSAGFNDGLWHHVVFTRVRSSGLFKLYVDGNVEGSATSANVNSLTGQANINLGRAASGNNYFEGSLDEVATYNVALDQPTVTAHFQAR